jgi:predicted dehydrogenase
MNRQSRRSFLKHTAAVGAGLTLPYLVPQSAFGANDLIHAAVAGIHSRGGAHISAYAKIPGCTVSYLVDPDSTLFASRAATVEKQTGKKPKCVQDIRQALEDKDVDVVSVATCNHWHSLITIWSCQAGKDVYVEKPCSHNPFEGRKCVEAARKYRRVVQHGTQSRSSKGTAEIIAAVQSGKYGKLLVAKAYCCKPRWSIGFKPVETPPATLDFNIWLGPAPEQPYHQNLVHYNWHWFWDTGNGDMGNQGVHEMDIARWGIGQTLPKSVVSLGCRYVNEKDLKDQGQTPNMELCVYDFDGTLLVFETRGLVAKKDKSGKDNFPFKVANDWHFEAGKISDGKFYPKGKDKGEPIGSAKKGKDTVAEHFANFIAAVRSRKSSDLNAEIEQGHYSAALCHLGNISYRLGQTVPFSQKPKDFPENEQVAESIQAIQENLKGALGMDLSKYTYQVGPKLAFDPKSEKFVDCPAADKLLTRAPRPPFAVPESV